jgi:hypothetical protein
LVNSKLVIADLTGRNPNVFYELAVRHVTRKPLVQIIRAEEEIPFDVQGMRTVKFELNDPAVLEAAREALARQVDAVLDEEKLETPISQAMGQQVAIESGDPGQVALAELSRSVQALTAEVRGSAGSYRPASGPSVFIQPKDFKWYTGPGSETSPNAPMEWDSSVIRTVYASPVAPAEEQKPSPVNLKKDDDEPGSSRRRQRKKDKSD